MNEKDQSLLTSLIDSYGIVMLLRYAAEYIGFGSDRFKLITGLANKLDAMSKAGL